MSLRHLLALALASSVLGGACSSGTAQPAAAEESDVVEQMSLVVELGGAITGRYQNDDEGVRIRKLESGASFRLFLLEIAAPIELTKRLTVKPGLNLAGYRGSGHYEIGSSEAMTPGSAPDSVTAESMGQFSSGWVEYQIGDDVSTFGRYRDGHCVVDLINAGLEGTMDCPDLTDEAGEGVSLRMSWRKG